MQFIFAGFMFIVTFLGSLFSSLISASLQFAAKKLFIIASMLVVLAAFIAAFYVAIKAAIDSISYVAPAALSQAASLVVPDNFVVLVTFQITARLIRFAYEGM